MENKNFEEKYAEYYDLFNTGKDYSKECDFLEEVFKKYSKNKIKDILDLGCGTGLHDIQLALDGYSVDGLDLSKEMIKIANSRKKSGTAFFVGDMANFDLNKKYDACISMFSAVGYLTDNKQISSCIKCVKKHLKPKGIFVLDCWNGLGVLRELPSSRVKEIKAGNLIIKRTSYPKLESVNQVCYVKFKVDIFENNLLKDSYEENHKVRFFFPQELKKYLEDEGFEVLEICPSYELNGNVDEKTWNMVVVSKLKG